MNISTRKIEIVLTKGDRKTLDDYAYACRRMANIAISRKFAYEKVKEFMSFTDEGKELIEKFSKDNGGMNTSDMNFMYKELSVSFSDVPSCIRAGLTRTINETYKKKKGEIHKGLSALPTFRNNMPIPFNIAAKLKSDFFKREETEDDQKPDYLLSPFGKTLGFDFKTRLGRDKSNNRHVIECIIKGHFQLCDSSIVLDKKKIFLLLTFKSPEKLFEKKDDIVVSMNLGINVPVYVTCNNGDHQMIGNKETLLYQRLAIQNSIKRLQKQIAFTKGGKGRDKKLAALDRFRKKERNFVKTVNHKLSYDIISFALKNDAATILIEDLKGIAKADDHLAKFVLRNWSYFELQQMITYKARKFGIEIKIVPTAYNTQKCINCGHVSEDNVNDTHMECVVCKHKIQKDHNNSLNSLNEYLSSLKV